MWDTASRFEETKGYSTKKKFDDYKNLRRTKESILKGMKKKNLGR